MPLVRIPIGYDRTYDSKPGDVTLPQSKWVRNMPGYTGSGGLCVWASAEMIFYGAAGQEMFKGVTERAFKAGFHAGDPAGLEATCKEYRVPYQAWRGYDYVKLKAAVEAGTGAVVFTDDHALALVGIDDQNARLVDPNGPRMRHWPVWYLKNHCEYACCPLLERIAGKPREPKLPGPVGPANPIPNTPAPTAPDLSPILNALAKVNDRLAALEARKPEKGDRGERGPAGERGPEGFPGQAGSAGSIPAIDYGKLADAIAARVKPDTIDYAKLAEEVKKRLPPAPATYEITPRK